MGITRARKRPSLSPKDASIWARSMHLPLGRRAGPEVAVHAHAVDAVCVMHREDAYGFSRTKKSGGLNRSYACPTRHFDGRGPSKNRDLFNILNDDSFSPPKRWAAGALTHVRTVPEVKPPLRKTAMNSDFKVRRLRIHELWQWRRRQSRPGPAPARLRRRRTWPVCAAWSGPPVPGPVSVRLPIPPRRAGLCLGFLFRTWYPASWERVQGLRK